MSVHRDSGIYVFDCMIIWRLAKKLLRKVFRPTRVVVTQCPVCQISANEMLKDKVALVTGGTSGIGRAIAEAFLNAGASVVIAGRSDARIKQTIEELSGIGCTGWIRGIVLDVSDVSSFSSKLQELLGIIHENGSEKLDILVNNAGIVGGSIAVTAEQEFDAVMDTNLKGAFFLSRCIGNYMKENRIQGNILNVASSSSLRPATSAYALSKWGIRGLTIGLAKLLIKYGIVVNGLAPGPTATPMLQADTNGNMYLESSPAGRWIHPAEVANMAVILVSLAGRMIVGDIVYMTGGAGIITQDDIKYEF